MKRTDFFNVVVLFSFVIVFVCDNDEYIIMDSGLQPLRLGEWRNFTDSEPSVTQFLFCSPLQFTSFISVSYVA